MNSWVKINRFIKRIFPNYIWDIPNTENKVFLTFDDGPTSEITEWTLEQLKLHNAKATFFCIGNNIQKYPEIFQKIINDGHAIGNHTFNHPNGWKTPAEEYIENVKLCQSQIFNRQSAIRKIFRPPYGKIKNSQSKALRKLGYKIIMWDVLSRDFDKDITPEKCLSNVLRNVSSGSVIVFHDSVKAHKNMKFALPLTLKFLNEKGFTCATIE